MDHDAEVGVEPDQGRPRPGVLLGAGAALAPQVHVDVLGDVLHHHQHVGHGDAWMGRERGVQISLEKNEGGESVLRIHFK